MSNNTLQFIVWSIRLGCSAVMAKVVAKTISVKDLLSNHHEDGQAESEEKEKTGIDPYLSMKLRGTRST